MRQQSGVARGWPSQMSPKAGTRPLRIPSLALAGDSAGLLSAPRSRILRGLPHFSGCNLPPRQGGPVQGPIHGSPVWTSAWLPGFRRRSGEREPAPQ